VGLVLPVCASVLGDDALSVLGSSCCFSELVQCAHVIVHQPMGWARTVPRGKTCCWVGWLHMALGRMALVPASAGAQQGTQLISYSFLAAA
jgi:hypothetical protein